MVALRGINRHDTAVWDKRRHGFSANLQTTSRARVRTPFLRRGNHVFDGTGEHTGRVTAFFTVRRSRHLKQRNRDQLHLLRIELFSANPGTNNFEVGQLAFLHALAHFGHDAQQVFVVQTSASPEIPAGGISGEVTKLDITAIGRLLLAAFPTGDGHCRIVKPAAKLRLIEVKFIAELANGLGPLGPRRFGFFRDSRHRWPAPSLPEGPISTVRQRTPFARTKLLKYLSNGLH